MNTVSSSSTGLAGGVDTLRLTLHVLAAAIWVGGQFTVLGILPTARALGPEAPKAVARAFSKLMWPAYAVLIITGVWNISATHAGQPSNWQAVLGAKMAVVVLAGVAAFVHTRVNSKSAVAIWGAVTGLTSIAALAMGVMLAG